MPVPTHSVDCITNIFPVKCQFCGDKIFLFTCTCGSKVYFDLSEPPWNPHEKRCFRYHIWYLKEVEKTPIALIKGIVEEYSINLGLTIPADVSEHLKTLENENISHKLKINNILPKNEPHTLFGVVVSKNLKVNFFKRFGLEDNSFGRGLIKKLLARSYVEIKLREETKSLGHVNEYNVFVPADSFTNNQININSRILIDIEPYNIVGRKKVWLGVDIKYIF